jgi:uncharacterized protein YnzC (UPF0291/DUF896 family)
MMDLYTPHWDYRIRAYYPPNKGGGLAIETVHRGEASRDMEISVFKARMARHEISHIEVIDCNTFKTETIYG